jgi:N-acetylglucosamine-6-phosphate deacetylase
MDRALRRAVLQLGVSMISAARAASTTPARAMGLNNVGEIAPGKRADFVVLNNELELQAVMNRGRWLPDPSPLPQFANNVEPRRALTAE